jgi:hypothetical protein
MRIQCEGVDQWLHFEEACHGKVPADDTESLLEMAATAETHRGGGRGGAP